MAKKAKQSAEQIAEAQMPGWKAVASPGPVRPFGAAPGDAGAERTPSKVDAVMPSTAELRRKYLGADAAAAADDSTVTPLEADVKLVDMQSGDIVRTVAVNRRTGKIEWSQG
jgi:hypothetical protein